MLVIRLLNSSGTIIFKVKAVGQKIEEFDVNL